MTVPTTIDTMASVIRDGIRFMESLTRHYGTDRGQEIWEGIGNVVGTEVKGKIFFAMVSGEISNRVIFSTTRCTEKVRGIKLIREFTGMGLREAKDLFESAQISPNSIDCTDSESARTLITQFRAIGCVA